MICLSPLTTANQIYTQTMQLSTTQVKTSNNEHNLLLDFENAIEWRKPNKINIHYGKTMCMLVGTRQRLNISREFNIQIENIRIQNVTEQKLMIFASKISLLRHLSRYVSIKYQKIIYQGYILPVIDYGCLTWGSTASLGPVVNILAIFSNDNILKSTTSKISVFRY